MAKFKFRFYYVIATMYIISIVVLSYVYSITDISKDQNIVAGLLTSFVLATVQLLHSWNDHVKVTKLEEIGVKKVLAHRDDESFYRELILNSKLSIDVLGSTAYRFLKDFADDQRADKQALLHALLRKVKVRILLPHKSQLFSTEDRHKSEVSHDILTILVGNYPSMFEFRYYTHMPAHSLVIIDNHCLAGPVFPHVSSKDSPAIYTDKDSPFTKPYLDYFEHEWNNARTL